MAQINQLPTMSASQVSGADNLPVYSSANGDARKLSLSALLSWFQDTFARQEFIKTISTPGDGFNITITQDGLNHWALLRPTGGLATGTLVLPAPSVATDGQEVLVTTTYQIAGFTLNGNGASEVNGAPSVLASGDNFKMRYESQTTSWYAV